MKSIWIIPLSLALMTFSMTACTDFSGSYSSEGHGIAVLRIQWPDQTRTIGPDNGNTGMLTTPNEQVSKSYAFDDCEVRNVAVISVEVTDDQERHLASASFACALRKGEIENIAVGPDRRFMISALDEDGNIRYYGEKTGVEIKKGLNEIGAIAIMSTGDVIIDEDLVVSITAPGDGNLHAHGAGVVFTGSATGTDGGEITGAALVWTSDIDEDFGTGNTVTTDALSPGIHVITLTATDSRGESGATSITINIAAPVFTEITQPPDGAVFDHSSAITFTGSATGTDGGELTGAALVWASDIDEDFGTGNTVTTDALSPGSHVITLTATDSSGDSGATSITINIAAIVNQSPAAAIHRPFGGSLHTTNAIVHFDGQAHDPEDGPLTGDALVWRSDRDGEIGSGASIAGVLSEGGHTITLSATDSGGETGVSHVYITVILPRLPDTGQRRSYTMTFGEDSDYTINPPSYTKLDQAGRPLPVNAVSWGMVQDNVTGLVWEVKATDGSIRHNDDLYNWTDAVHEFIYTLNQERFGGYSDWRLPTIMELYTIIHADNLDPAINTAFFPNMPGIRGPWYLSSTSVLGLPGTPRVVEFLSGQSPSDYAADAEHYVRAVRGPVLQTARYMNNLNGTVTDMATGLMWPITDYAGYNNYGVFWEEGIDYCESLTLEGYTDWRMPNRHELHSVFDYGSADPSFDDIFDISYAYDYWSSTSWPHPDPDPDIPLAAYAINFSSGDGLFQAKTDFIGAVLCVRGGN